MLKASLSRGIGLLQDCYYTSLKFLGYVTSLESVIGYRCVSHDIILYRPKHGLTYYGCIGEAINVLCPFVCSFL